ncbi:hypothetical protein E8D34_06660 [Nocardioides sp. GY 10113]|uniref:hypothetical protein n=1 Tax=Nocardioides sp. GY 10113 TaxID=2569761 RepID=UPI0010A79801|nr:hypothetical protein [Nocardioides sp. GY 10113]TIC87969.1 hypothetical protein E8D34_06660 [Nocardioides sp. GY 10113]
MHTPTLRRTGATLATAALAVALVGCGSDSGSEGADAGSESSTATTTATSTAAGEAAAGAAAAWFAGQLTDGVLVNEEYDAPDYGGTVDAIYSLEAVGGHDADVDAMTEAVYAHAQEYAAPDQDVWAGNAGKLVALATDNGDDPSDLDGFDALGTLLGRIDESGRTSDKSQYGDFANSLGQAWAVRGLAGAGAAEAAAATDFLLLQQCADGFFRQDFSKPKAKDQSCDGDGGTASVDATALAVLLLGDVAADDEDLATALEAAVAYLVGAQADDGSFEGGADLPANANSTGLAARALAQAGEDEAAAAAAGWLRAHQVGDDCAGALADASGAIAYDDAAVTGATQDGITAASSYQWRLATAQALPGLLTAPEDAAAACPAA